VSNERMLAGRARGIETLDFTKLLVILVCRPQNYAKETFVLAVGTFISADPNLGVLPFEFFFS
jgi:hypothetical protein